MDHSHLAIDVDLIDKVDEEVMTPFGELKKSSLEDDVQFLKPKSNKHDKEFLNQLAYLQSLMNLVSNDNDSRDLRLFLSKILLQFTEEKEKPTALNVRVSLGILAAKHSESPTAVAEATKLLVATIEKLSASVAKAYDGNAVFAVITVAEHHVRAKRAVDDEVVSFNFRNFAKFRKFKIILHAFQTAENPYNLAELTSKNFPVVFNIMFWFTIIFIFSLIAISLALSNVEDKDSIIYRMTGARGKKDN